MQVAKRDGTKETVKIEKILHAVNEACRGLENVEAIEVAKRRALRTLEELGYEVTLQEAEVA